MRNHEKNEKRIGKNLEYVKKVKKNGKVGT